MPSRSRHAILASLAVVLLALPATALWLRITVHFLAKFDVAGAPGGTPPLAADAGAISVSGAGFSVVPDGTGNGGALLAQGTGGPLDVTLSALFDSVFKGSDLIITWTVTPGQSGAGCSMYAIEENDSEIIDVTWGGGGWVDVDGMPVDTYHEGVSYDCKLVLRDAVMGQDTWMFTMHAPGGAPVTKSGPLSLGKPLAVDMLKIVLPAGGTGSFVFDDLQATSNSPSYK